jgi:hypothetical protein
MDRKWGVTGACLYSAFALPTLPGRSVEERIAGEQMMQRFCMGCPSICCKYLLWTPVEKQSGKTLSLKIAQTATSMRRSCPRELNKK